MMTDTKTDSGHRLTIELSEAVEPEFAEEVVAEILYRRRKQLEIIDLFGKMNPDPGYDYKKGRPR